MNPFKRLQTAWQLSGALKTGVDPSQIQRALFQHLASTPIMMEDNAMNYITNGYEVNPDVYSVINHITRAESSVPVLVLEVKNAKKARKYYQMKQNWRYRMSGLDNVMELKEEAFEEVDPEDDLAKLIDRPNPLQAWPEFYENFRGFQLATGNTYAHGIPLTDDRIGEMWVLPPQFTRIKASAGFESLVEAYELWIYGRATDPIPERDVIHMKYWNPDYSHTGSHLYGMSPLRAARATLRSSNDGSQALAKAYKNMGAAGMLSPEDPDVDLSPKQISQIESFLDKKGSRPENFKAILAFSAKMKWTNFGMSPVDLAIIEGKKLGTREICNIYQFPSELLNDPDNKTNSNKAESRKQLWLDVGIPGLERTFSELNRWLLPRFKDKKYFLDYDVSGVEALQEDQKMKAEWLNTAWWLTPNQKLAEMDFEQSDNPLFDQPWVDFNKMPLSQLTGDPGELPDDLKALLKQEYQINGN